jgi:hypothetical protein
MDAREWIRILNIVTKNFTITDIMKNIDPEAIKNLMLLFAPDNELIIEYYAKLQNYIETYPDDAKKMTLDEFLQAHTEMADDIKNETNIKNIIRRLSDSVAQITDKNLSHALTPYPNKYAYIQQISKKYFDSLDFNPEDGTMRTKDNSLEPITLKDIETRSNLKELDLPLLRTLYTAIYSYASKIDTDTVTIPLPTLAKYMGINARGEGDKSRAGELMEKITSFRHVLGVMNNGNVYPLLVFFGYNKAANTITFGSPYMNRVILALNENNKITPKGKPPYIKPNHSFLVHANIANERNKSAVEIVHVIVCLLMQRGEQQKEKEELTSAKIEAAAQRGAQKGVQKEFSDDPADNSETHTEPPTITKAHKAFREIIEEIPQLSEALENAGATSTKNNILKRSFSRAYELLKEKTDVYKYYNNLIIPDIIPTSGTLDSVLNITHEGINKKYKI